MVLLLLPPPLLAVEVKLVALDIGKFSFPDFGLFADAMSFKSSQAAVSSMVHVAMSEC